MLLIASGFIFLDQGIQLVITKFFLTKRFNLIGESVTFLPVHNTNLSWAGNYIRLLANPFVTIAINLFLLFFIVNFFSYYTTVNPSPNFFVSSGFVLLFSGAVCSLLDKVFWGGSWDFVNVRVFVFDLKDVYLIFGILALLILSLTQTDSYELEDYLNYLRRLFSLKKK